MRLLVLLLVSVLAAPAQADTPPTAAPLVSTEAANPTADTPGLVDPLTLSLAALVERFHTGLGHPATDLERGTGVNTLRSLLLAGISIPALELAVEEAVRLHNPARPLPFELAVPLQIRQPSDPESLPPFAEEDEPQIVEGPEAPGRAAVVAKTSRRTSRAANYRIWRRKQMGKRTLLSVGIPLYAASTVLSFGVAAGMYTDGSQNIAAAWVTAIPVVGGLIYGVGIGNPGVIYLGASQIAGFGLILAGALLPLEKLDDPEAGSGRGPRLVLLPTGAGGALIGRF